MIKRTWALILILSITFGCQRHTHNAHEDPPEPDVAASSSESKGALPAQQVNRAVSSKLASGLYRGGLRVAIHGNTISGYYEDTSGWNEQINAPQFSCEYHFVGEYAGSDTIALTLPTHDGATGTLEILPGGNIKVNLSVNPCNNEEPSTEIWELEDAYPLVSIRTISSEKSHFYAGPEERSPRGAYLVKGDKAEVRRIEGEWYQVLYHGARATTEGWMPATAFEDNKPSEPILGAWLSKAGEPLEVYYEFYPDGRYKTWGINSLEPQGMAGSFAVVKPDIISLQPCGKAATTMAFRVAETGEVSLMIPGTDRWTVFEKRSGDSHVETAVFSIEKRQIITTVNNRTLSIPSATTRARFLQAVCPFEVTPDVIAVGEGTFSILRVSTIESGQIFYAVLDGEDVTALVIERPIVRREGISVGSTFGEVKKAMPSVSINRSEIEGKVVGSDEHCSFSFGYVSAQLFDAGSKTIPDSVKIRQIIL